MSEELLPLPSRVTTVALEGKTIYIVGTAHVSSESVRDVEETIALVQPDTIAIELCPPRYQSMIHKDSWQQTNIFQVVKEKKSTFLLAQLAMQAFYRRIGKQLEVQPGAEMMAGARCADETGAALALIDRRIDITLKRVWRHLGFWQRCKLMMVLVSAVFGMEEDVSAEDVESLKNSDQLDAMMGEMGKEFPEVKKRLIDERDIYLAQKLRACEGRTIVAVVGAGHVPGMVKHIQQAEPLDELETLPPKSKWSKVWPWLIPAVVVALIVWRFCTGGMQQGIDSIVIWVLVNGALSALGTMLVFAHPLTILSAFIAAPITSLNPAIAAGWVAGLVQAWVRPPAVADFETLPSALENFKTLVRHPLIRILLVVVLANIGSSIGTFVSLAWIAAR